MKSMYDKYDCESVVLRHINFTLLSRIERPLPVEFSTWLDQNLVIRMKCVIFGAKVGFLKSVFAGCMRGFAL